MKIELSDKKTIEDIIEIIASKLKEPDNINSFLSSSDVLVNAAITISGGDPKLCLLASIIVLSSLPYDDFFIAYGFTKDDIVDVIKDVLDQDDKNPIHTRLNNLVKNQPKSIC